MKTLVLGSTSPFRKTILEKLNLPFVCAKPNIDETPLTDETPIELVKRLAIEKAQAVSEKFTSALIIGSDQVAVCDGAIIGKPHTHENAISQLTQFSGKSITFYTGLCVFCTDTNTTHTIVEPFTVEFKTLAHNDIVNYLLAEQPYNCAGSFKSEGLGICLFERLTGDDPNTLIGLPLIKLVELLKRHGLNVLAEQSSAV